ncbi:MAG: hypothetical protein JO023_05565, partial [Chloroflexi bacterium]|nr:hypothetical protein [Chloroflexota bacterium]
TVPTFLYAIQVRWGFVLALRNAHPDIETPTEFAAFRAQEGQAMLQRLSNTYDLMRAGLVTSPLPRNTHDDFLAWDRAVQTTPVSQVDASPVGAVDIYTGINNVEQFQVGALHTDLDYQAFAAGFRLNNTLRRKRLYASNGIDGVWSALQELRGMVGQVPETIDRDAAWSLRDIQASLGTLFVTDPAHQLGGIVLSGTIGQLLALARLPGNPDTGLQRPVSLRSALTGALKQRFFQTSS